jgi:putative hemolysin
LADGCRRSRPILTEILLVVVLALANGILAGAEIAIVALRRSRLAQLADSGNRAARAVSYLRDHPERFLATVQIGITVLGATAGAYGGSTLAARIEPWIASLPVVGEHARGVSLALVVALVSYLSLVLGELVPKSLALRASEPYALLVGRPLVGLSWIARPLVHFLTVSSNVVLRLFGDRTTFTETRVSPEELQVLVDEAARAGTVHPHAGEIASRAIDFGRLRAADVMVPRSQVVAVPKNIPNDELHHVVLEAGHWRLPVYGDTLDDVIGYIAAKDLLALAWERQLIIVADLVRPAYFVPETMDAPDLLKEMQRRRTHLAIVVDEQGGFSGIVTMEDLVEELVGEIFSEQSSDVPDPIRVQPDGSAVVSGLVAIRDVNRALDVELPESPQWATIAGLALALAERIPQPGERLTTENEIVLEIVDASPRRVRSVRVIRPRPIAEKAAAIESPTE